MGLPGVQAAPTSPQTIDSTVSPGRSQAQFNTPKYAGISSSVLDRPSFSDFLEANPLDAASMQARINEISAIQNDLMSKGMSQIRAYSTAKRQVEEREDAEREIQQQSSLDPDRITDAVTGGFREGIGAMAPAFETAGSIDTTPFQQVSPNIRQVNPLSPVERVMRSLGMKTRRAPRSQLYSPSKKEDSFFDLRRLLPSIDT